MAFLNAFGAIGRLLVLGAVAAGVGGVVTAGGTRLGLLVTAVAVGVTGIVFILIGSKLGRVAGLDRALRETGVAGTATVVSVSGTGLRVNGAPLVEISLDVDVSSHPGYRTVITQRVPLFWGPLEPGAVIGVVVDPNDRDHLAVDWDATVSGPPSAEASPSEVPIERSRVRDAEHLLRAGRRAAAVIISMTDAGDMSELGLVEVGRAGEHDRLFVVDMEIQQPGLDPYEVRVAHHVPERLVGRVGPRTRVRVAIDRDDDQAVAIDWTSVGGRRR